MKTFYPTRPLTTAQREELTQLLASSLITSAASVERRGNSVYCVIDVSPSETTVNRFDVMLLVFDTDGELLMLEDVAFTAAGETPEGELLLHVGRRTKRGIPVIEGLHCQATYHLDLLRVAVAPTGEPIQMRSGSRYAMNADTQNADYALHADDGASETEEAGTKLYGPFRSADGRLTAAVADLGPGGALVEISTRDPALADATVQFRFVDEQDRVLHSGEVQLTEQAGDPGLWTGTWQGPLALAAPCRPVFAV